MSIPGESPIPIGSPQVSAVQKKNRANFSHRKMASLVLTSLKFDDDLNKDLIPEHHNSTIDKVVFEEIV
jgi:hypothetical protein